MLQWIEQDPELLELLSGKEVALIGPAPYLINKGYGEIIDNCDLIARPNEVIPLPNLRSDYGSRTDIFFCNFGTTWMPGIKRKISLNDNEEHFKNIKMVVASAIKAKHSDVNFLSWPDNHVSDIPDNFNSINEYNLPFYWIGVKNYKNLYNQIGVEFNTGIAAITILLHYPISKLKIYGFTFYQGGSSYKELYCDGHMDRLDTDGRSFGFSSGHGSYANTRQIQYFKEIHDQFKDTITIDKEMQEILYDKH